MSSVLNAFKQEKCTITGIGGILIGATAIAGITCLLYKKIRIRRHILQMMCCDCLDDGGLEALMNDIESYYDENEDGSENKNA